MKIVLGRMTKCTFHKFGTSGNIEKHDALCILPLNIGEISVFCFFCILPLNIGEISVFRFLYSPAQYRWYFKPIRLYCIPLSTNNVKKGSPTFLHPPSQYRLLPKERSTQWNHLLCSQRKDLHLHFDLFPLPIFFTSAFSKSGCWYIPLI